MKASKIKIIQFIHGLNMGGAETLVKDYVIGINKNKFDITVLCYERRNSPYEKILKEAGIQVIYICDELPFYGKQAVWAKIINRIMRYVLIRKYILAIKPDIIHEHLILSSYLRFAKPKKPVAIVYTQHFQVERWKKCYKKDMKSMMWLLRHYNVQMIALDNYMKQEMNDLFGIDNTIVLKNGIERKRFSNLKDKSTIRLELGIPQDAFVVGHVGRFSFVKNHTYLIQIFEELCKRNEKAFLLMVGKGETKSAVYKQLEKLKLTDKILLLSDRTDIPELLKAMDIFVFPSYSEGLGISLIEAQMAGIPCMVSSEVPKTTKISNLIKYFNLEEKPSKWAENILNWKQETPVYYHIEQWDMNQIISALEKRYEELFRAVNEHHIQNRRKEKNEKET